MYAFSIFAVALISQLALDKIILKDFFSSSIETHCTFTVNCSASEKFFLVLSICR